MGRKPAHQRATRLTEVLKTYEGHELVTEPTDMFVLAAIVVASNNASEDKASAARGYWLQPRRSKRQGFQRSGS